MKDKWLVAIALSPLFFAFCICALLNAETEPTDKDIIIAKQKTIIEQLVEVTEQQQQAIEEMEAIMLEQIQVITKLMTTAR